MSPPTVWFNKHLSNTWEAFKLLQESRRHDEFHILCTHPRGTYPGRECVDHFEQEPGGLGEQDYLNYCLSMLKRRRVEAFFPGRQLLSILRERQRFEALGVRIVAAGDADALALVSDKAKTYAALAGTNIRLPDYAVVNDLAGFDAAWERLRPRHALLCYKPAVSVYGLGFRIVADRGAAQDEMRHGSPFVVSLEDARRDMARRPAFRDLLLMEYLPGPERSIDCLARDGVLIRCVVRRKEPGGQVLEDNPDLVAAARLLTAHFRLNSLFNIQFRDTGGKPNLLEINPRMSGGLPFACQSGVQLPLWAIRLALGTAQPEDVPEPRAGIWVPQPAPVSSL